MVPGDEALASDFYAKVAPFLLNTSITVHANPSSRKQILLPIWKKNKIIVSIEENDLFRPVIESVSPDWKSSVLYLGPQPQLPDTTNIEPLHNEIRQKHEINDSYM
ncbi:hypothetical protein ACF0H5_012363 [Mactra antiquata]